MKKINKLFLTIVFLSILASPIYAQKKESIFQVKKRHVVRSGPIFGFEKGQFIGLDLGAEKQWKQLKFKNAPTIAINSLLSYDYLNEVLGFDLGSWYKRNTLGFTLGASFGIRSDFNYNNYRFVFTPTLGYKIWQLHAMAGYHFLSPSTSFIQPINTVFVGLRFVLINNSKVKK